jgi:hypothetical protein
MSSTPEPLIQVSVVQEKLVRLKRSKELGGAHLGESREPSQCQVTEILKLAAPSWRIELAVQEGSWEPECGEELPHLSEGQGLFIPVPHTWDRLGIIIR